jgi:hypothetical protein
MDGCPAPAHRQLGAKWVDVKAGGTSGNYRDEENELKTWPATPVRSVVRFSPIGRCGLVGMLPIEAGAAGAGQPFIRLIH